MKKLILFSVLALATITVNAQWWSTSKKISGNKDVTTQTRNLENYNAVSVTGMMKVELYAGKEGRIEIEAESNLIEYITTEVTDGKLKISVEKGISLQPSSNYSIKVKVPVESIEAVMLTGSGDVYSSSRISADSFSVKLTGSGDVALDLDTKELEGILTGSGDVHLKGNAGSLTCKVIGSGDFKAYELTAKHADASVSGSGDIQITVSDELKARIAGSGDISYRGNPEKEDLKSVGSGKVSKK